MDAALDAGLALETKAIQLLFPSQDQNERIAALEKVREGLSTLIAACPGHGRAEHCPILNALGGEHAS